MDSGYRDSSILFCKMSDKKPEQKKKEKEKPYFHKTSDAGKGDVPRTNITQAEWGEKWEKIFKSKEKNR